MSAKDYVFEGLLGLAVCLFVGTIFGKYISTPNSIYVKELNSDNRSDLIVKQRNGVKTVFLQQEDGRYQRLDNLQEQMRNSIEEKVKDIE